jgi:plastocyanin
LVLATVASAACGGSSGQPAGSIKVSMTEFAFAPKDISAPAGKVVFYLVNAGQASHDMVVFDSSQKQVAKSELVQAGNGSVFTIDSLPTGTYTIVCDLPGHREAGMVGTLTVK